MIQGEPNSPHPAVAEASLDSTLLRRYADAGDEGAFAELVRRRIGLVYTVALRRTGGDAHRAQDATQAVFTDLARKAKSLCTRPVLVGWLYRSAQFAAAGLVRAEQRRQLREQQAEIMHSVHVDDRASAEEWERVRPVLDGVLNEMDERDRDAILLRFFDGRAFAEIGAQLQLSEGAARMRVERALDKLHAALARRGITSSAAALGLALGAQAAAAPIGLATSVTGAALAASGVSAVGWAAGLFAMNKIQVGVIAAIALGGAAGYTAQRNTQVDLRRELEALQEQQKQVAALRADNDRLARAAAEVEALRRDDVELKELEQKISAVRTRNQENVRVARQKHDEQQVKAEIERMNREGNASVNDYKALKDRAKDPGLTNAEKAEAESAAKAKFAEIQAKQREIQNYIQSVRMNSPQLAGATDRAQPTLRASTAPAESKPWDASTPVTMRLPQADLPTAISAYEVLSGRKLVRDASLAQVRGRIDFRVDRLGREEAAQRLGDALRDQLGIVITAEPDGSFSARRATAP